MCPAPFLCQNVTKSKPFSLLLEFGLSMMNLLVKQEHSVNYQRTLECLDKKDEVETSRITFFLIW